MIAPTNLDEWNLLGKNTLPGHLGIVVVSVEPDRCEVRMAVREAVCAPNGFLHAGSVAALADTACGYATINSLPEGARGFTTIELKANFIGTALEGDVICVATPLHRGRSTQVWEAKVHAGANGKVIASFGCTQIILWPKPGSPEE